ncbi:MAG: RHS repeat protein [Candidatus Pseudobacter hemicellulosilyticus]|uniref:RHS repeat protein n=1 Tax=Candidatus Pseudobacter hemicellulosilyticus TaxID=3121375 RepID=A0AAJ5WQS9_9BACT|nr:MAG: RHS repeat protein [Pseudobacter sp.]
MKYFPYQAVVSYFRNKGTGSLLFCLIVLQFHPTGTVTAQTSNAVRYQVFAPNTYELGKYGDVPVDMATGVPQIRVPLVSFSDRDLNLDISLSYHASGIKVDQEATWVGLGWALIAGGMITRELRGKADDYDPATSSFASRTDIPDYTGLNATDLDNYINQVENKLSIAADNGTDNGADIFYYNFNGRAGRFFLDNDARPVFSKYEDLKVEFLLKPGVNPNREYFVITDERGVKYEFSDIELTDPVLSGVERFDYISAWYLSRITSPSGAEITIEYVRGGLCSYNFQRRCYDQVYFAVNPNTSEQVLPDETRTNCINYDARIYGIVPKKITSSSGNYVEFITAASRRLDSDPTLPELNNQLDFVVLRNSAGEQLKRKKLSYSYFEANDNRKFPGTGSSDGRNYLNYRLRLDAVQEVSVSGQLQNPYRFEYYGDNDPLTSDAYTLPYRLSPSQDHWGYYNNSFNTVMFPDNAVNKPYNRDEAFEYVAGQFGGTTVNFGYSISTASTREPDEEALKAGLLNKLIFPTGGYTLFDFEGHNLSAPGFPFYPLTGGVRIRKIESLPATGATPVVKNYTYESTSIVDYNKCLSLPNPYYSIFWRTTDYELMMAAGVPADLAMQQQFVGKAEASPQLMLGSGMHPVYQTIVESSPGNGRTVYEYESTSEDNEEYAHNGGVQIPRLFYTAHLLIRNIVVGSRHLTLPSYPCIFPWPSFLNNDWRRGQLKTKSVWSAGNSLVSEESIEYDIRSLKAIPNYRVIQVDNQRYFYNRFYTIGGYVKPVNQVTKTFDGNGNFVRTEKRLKYTSVSHKQLTESRDLSSAGDTIVTRYYYPPEYGNALVQLNDKHILLPVDVRRYKEGKLIGGEQVKHGVNGLPQDIYRAEPTGAGADIPFNALAPYTFFPQFSNVYNADNSLRSQNLAYGSSTVFIWSYKGQQPVARIQHASYEEVKAALDDASETFINALRGKAEPTTADMSRLNSLRSHAALKKAAITTYTFKPLVGMKSETDPAGRTTYYEYDEFGRLVVVKDDAGKVLKAICYNYAGEPVNCN